MNTPFRRLLAVETRKLIDTRTAACVLGSLLTLLVGAIAVRGAVAGPHLRTLLGTAGLGLGTLLPVLGILTVTGEWSHRTTLTTFTLEPRRRRVLAAKAGSLLGATLAAVAFALLVSALTTAATGAATGARADWGVPLPWLTSWLASTVLLTASGFALGLLLLNAPAAIVLYLSTPMLWSLAHRAGGALHHLATWCDVNSATGALASDHLTGHALAQVATSALLWIIIPAALGTLRILRTDLP